MIQFDEHKALIPQNFPNNAKVWIYQSNRLFSISEAFELEDMLENFINNWHSHGSKVSGFANLFYGQFIVILADESACKVGGCSTDSSVRLIKQIEQTFNVDLLSRQNLAFVVKNKIQILPINQLNYAVNNKFINSETLYFNNLVTTKEELMKNWIVPINQSWLINKIDAFKN